jgi:hypothetical protein
MRGRRVAAVALAATALVALTACAPDPGPVSEGPKSSWATEFSACMSERGWTVSIESDGGVVGEYPESQRAIYELDTAECSNAAGADVVPTEAQFEAGYKALLANRECIVGEGYDLPEAPTYQAWREIDGKWNPFLDLPEITGEQLDALIAVCEPVGIG